MTDERGKRLEEFLVTYQHGHPNVEGSNIPSVIQVFEKEFVVKRYSLLRPAELFALPYEKIESVTTDIENEWKGTRMAVGLVALGPLGALLFGKKKTEQLGLVVRGKDGEGNTVQIPIVFAPAKSSGKIKAMIDQKIGQARQISI